MAVAPIKNLVLGGQKPFYLAVSLRQIKKLLLCVLGDSAVRTLFWTSMLGNIDFFFSAGILQERY
jgi:hypothetical protein